MNTNKNKTYKHLQKHAYKKAIEAFKTSSVFGKVLVGLGFFVHGWKKIQKLKCASALQIFDYSLRCIH